MDPMPTKPLTKFVSFFTIFSTVGNTYCPEEPTPRIKEAYEDVQGFENCLKEVFIPDKPTPTYCLPAKKPKNCLQKSWLELQTLLPSVDALEECNE